MQLIVEVLVMPGDVYNGSAFMGYSLLSPGMPLLAFSKDMVLELGAPIKFMLLIDS
jgi:hypothetical protein